MALNMMAVSAATDSDVHSLFGFIRVSCVCDLF